MVTFQLPCPVPQNLCTNVCKFPCFVTAHAPSSPTAMPALTMERPHLYRNTRPFQTASVAYFWCSTNMGRFQLSFYIFNSKTLWKIDGGVRKAEILDGEEPAYTWGIFCVQKKTKPCQSTGNEVPKKQWNQQTWGVKLFKCDLRQVGWFHS